MHAIVEIQKGSGAGFWVQMVSMQRVSLPDLHGVIFWGSKYHVIGHQVTDVLQGGMRV